MGEVVRMRNRGRVVGSLPFGGGLSRATRDFAAVHTGVLAEVADDGVAASRQVIYRCLAGHDIPIRFAETASVPRVWECTVHRAPSPLLHAAEIEAAGAALADEAEAASRHVPKTHWEHVLERRTPAELEVLLEERLALLRERRSPDVSADRVA